MVHLLDPASGEKELEQGLISEVKKFFPYEGRKHRLEVTDVYVTGKPSRLSISSQSAARNSGRVWGYTLSGDFKVVDKATGKVLGEKKKVSLAKIPYKTQRYSYIMGGSEYQADKQWRLKSGVFARVRGDGDLETQYNLVKGQGFRMLFDPVKQRFKLKYGTSNLDLYPVLKTLGSSDEDIKKSWGPKLLESGKKYDVPGSYVKIAKALDKYSDPQNDVEAQEIIRDVYSKTELRTDTTKQTLGKEFSKVDKGSLLAGSTKLLNIHKGLDTVDNRDSYKFKELWSIEDHLPERIRNSRTNIRRKIANNIDRHTDPSKIVTRDLFNTPIKHFFTTTSLAQQGAQTNPLSMINGQLRATILGQGGISTDRAVTLNAKLIDASHLGITDPVATPEGKRSGITTNLGINTGKVGNEATALVWDMKQGKMVGKTATDLASAVVAFPDDFRWKNGVPVPLDKKNIKALHTGNTTVVGSKDVDYVLATPRNMFSMTTNMIPFLPSTQGGRAEMAVRHLEQAVSLKNRENPLVQVHSGNRRTNETWEKIVGRFTAHTSPVDGTVVSVKKDSIVVKDSANKKHRIELYNNFPLNDTTAYISAAPLVAVGDTVKSRQVVADNNFTKNGVLSLGTNMRIAYLPYKGLTFEDGIIISETAQNNDLVSLHMHKPRIFLESNMKTSKKDFRTHYPSVLTDANAEKLNDNGIIKIGSQVKPGDVLVAALAKTNPTTEQILMKGIHKSLAKEYKDVSVVWEKDQVGVVSGIIRNGKEVKVLVNTEEKAKVGDKLSGRYGNKGVITAILPDEEMPRDKDGNPVHIIVNPSGVPGRINPSQIHETRLGKVAAAKGDVPFAVANFENDDSKKIVEVPGHYRTVKTKEGEKQVYIEPYSYERDYNGMVEYQLRKHGLTGEEELFDPETGKSLGSVMVGHQYILKLKHQVDKGLSARSYGHGYEYDSNMSPSGSGKGSAQRYGNLGMFAMLAHGSTASIQEGLTYKSDETQREVWDALQNNMPLPPPRTSFASEKFFSYLEALGVDVEKRGNDLVIMPMTNEDILDKSNGELTNPTRVLRGKDLKVEKGGLFDEDITGGFGGDGWSHIKLATAIPNPMFESAITSVLGIKRKDYRGVISGTTYINERGELSQEKKTGYSTGPAAIVAALSSVNVKQQLAEAKEELKDARGNKMDKLNKRVKYLSVLDRESLEPEDVYSISNLPVLPPIFRPIASLEGGDLSVDGINQHYREVALLNDALKDAEGLPASFRRVPEEKLYGAIAALMGTAPRKPGQMMSDGKTEEPPGILDLIGGRGGPKSGFLLSSVVDKKQDTSGRSVIVPNLDLSLDQVGVPRIAAMTLFAPYIKKELIGMGMTPLDAELEIEKKTPLANKALERVVKERPIQFKRDPVLWKYGIQGFDVKLIDEGKAIHIHPLAVGGFNADFDGDKMALFVPLTKEAIEETHRMKPSNNIFNPGSGRVVYMPALEGQLGMFLLTQMGNKTSKSYSSLDAAIRDFRAGNVAATDIVKAGKYSTTAGRASLYMALPEKHRDERILTDSNYVMNSRNLEQLMSKVAKDGTSTEFVKTADNIKRLGWGHAHNIGFSFKDSDFKVLQKIRDKHLKIADAKAAPVLSTKPSPERDAKLVAIYSKATEDMAKEAKRELPKQGNALYSMYAAGVKPKWPQLQQLLLAPMLLENADGSTIPVPVRKSYTEGLTSAGYFTAAFGARKGLIEKVQSVSEPGALNKQVMNTMMSTIITKDDCSTKSGISLDSGSVDIVDRMLVKPVKLKSGTVPSGTVITPRLQSKLMSASGKVVVRSPTKCEAAEGICSKCYGKTAGGKYYPTGTAIGVIAGQAIGERGTQLSMKQFHTGGVSTGGSGVVSGLDRVTQLLKMPQKLPGQATLSKSTGVVSRITKSPSGGHDVTVGSTQMYVPQALGVSVKVGDKVRKGDAVSGGIINPRDLLELTNVDRVAQYLSTEIHDVYKQEGIKRRNAEVVSRALTNLAVVSDAGDSDKVLKGDFVQASHIRQLNNSLTNKIQITPILKGIETLPIDQTDDFLVKAHYRNIKQTLREAPALGLSSDIHGPSPIPGIVYNAEFGKSGKGSSRPY